MSKSNDGLFRLSLNMIQDVSGLETSFGTGSKVHAGVSGSKLGFRVSECF